VGGRHVGLLTNAFSWELLGAAFASGIDSKESMNRSLQGIQLISRIAKKEVIMMQVEPRDIMTLIQAGRIVGEGIKGMRGWIQKMTPLTTSFWRSGKQKKGWSIIFGTEKASDRNEIEPRLGYGEAFGISEFVNVFRLLGIKNSEYALCPLMKQDPLKTDFFEGESDLIIMGGELTLTHFQTLNIGLGVPYYQFDLNARERVFSSKMPEYIDKSFTSECSAKGDLLQVDYGTITRIMNPRTGRLIILFNGNYSAGLLGAILYVTREEWLSRSRFDKRAPNQQIVVRVDGIQHNLIDTGHESLVAETQWIPFDMKPDVFVKTARKCCGPVKRSRN
jgi:hypothetical protein